MKPYELFEILSGKTWRSIERFNRNRIHLGEDAITSNNLDALASAGPACVFIEDTRATESTKGCDFELWIGSSYLGWRRYAVQAKKIQVSSSRYGSLTHQVAGTPQIDILDKYAKANKAAAIYCFYNYSLQPYKWNCNLPCEIEQLGCSVTPSSIVRAAIKKHGARNFEHIHSQTETLPWRCLVRCPNFTSKASLSHSGWPKLDEYLHKELPKSLNLLRTQGGRISFEGQSDLFSSEIPTRPEWIGIIDVSPELDLG